MKITKISLTNFRSFKETQTIHLAPVTLFFGPNSVGKSSILVALAYVQQILAKGHCDPQKLDALGSKSIGGFRSLVHGQDLKKNIKIKLDFEPDKTPFVLYDADVVDMSNHIQGASYLLMEDFGGNINTGAIEFEIAWSQRYQKAYVKFYRVWINDDYIGCISSSEDQKNTEIQALNTLHPLLIPYNTDEWLESEYGEEDERVALEADQYHTEFEYALDSLNPARFAKTTKSDGEDEGLNVPNRIGSISVACRNGAVPYMGSPVLTNLNGQDFDDIEEHLNFLIIRQVLSQAFVLPLDKLLEYLQKSILIINFGLFQAYNSRFLPFMINFCTDFPSIKFPIVRELSKLFPKIPSINFPIVPSIKFGIFFG